MSIQPKVSVIIPIYKAEKYIERCARALFSQTLPNMEFIFVDDCSPDASIAILKHISQEYPNRSHQFKIIKHTNNTGVAQARQDGINEASGEYLIHCDPDDWPEIDMYEKMYNAAKEYNADIVLCDYNLVTAKNVRNIVQKPSTLNSRSILRELSLGKLYGSFWNKLVKLETIKEYNVYLIKELNVCEDLFFFLQLLKKELTIAYIPEALYNYDFCINPNSIQRKSLDNHIEMDEKIIRLAQEILNENQYNEERSALTVSPIFHIFLISSFSDQEFSSRYGKYKGKVRNSKSLKIWEKIFLYLAIKGQYNLSKRFYNLFKTIKHVFH